MASRARVPRAKAAWSRQDPKLKLPGRTSCKPCFVWPCWGPLWPRLRTGCRHQRPRQRRLVAVRHRRHRHRFGLAQCQLPESRGREHRRGQRLHGQWRAAVRPALGRRERLDERHAGGGRTVPSGWHSAQTGAELLANVGMGTPAYALQQVTVEARRGGSFVVSGTGMLTFRVPYALSFQLDTVDSGGGAALAMAGLSVRGFGQGDETVDQTQAFALQKTSLDLSPSTAASPAS